MLTRICNCSMQEPSRHHTTAHPELHATPAQKSQAPLPAESCRSRSCHECAAQLRRTRARHPPPDQTSPARASTPAQRNQGVRLGSLGSIHETCGDEHCCSRQRQLPEQICIPCMCGSMQRQSSRNEGTSSLCSHTLSSICSNMYVNAEPLGKQNAWACT